MKPLKRREYLALTGLSVEAFKSLARRGHVPLLAPLPSDDEGLDEASRRGLFPVEAVMMILATELARSINIEPAAAASLVGRNPDLVVNALERLSSSKFPVWISITSDHVVPFAFAGHVGTADMIVDYLSAGPCPGEMFSSATLLNVTAAVNLLRTRAAEIGVDLPETLVLTSAGEA